MRTISNLLALDGRVCVLLRSRALGQLFLRNAEEEGFTFGDGVKPTERHFSDIFALNDDWTLNYVGFIGHMAFYNAQSVGGQTLYRVDYGKYIAGRDDYIITLDELAKKRQAFGPSNHSQNSGAGSNEADNSAD